MINQKEYPKYFGVKNLGEIRWAHAVNDRKKFQKYLNDQDIDFLEFDIRVSIEGEIIAIHPPAMESDLLFEYILERADSSKQGIKLDFKDPEILVPCLKLLAEANLKQPIMLNANILQGNGTNPAKFNPVGFIALRNKYYPQGLLSIGWIKTADTGSAYTNKDMGKILDLFKEIEGCNITFPISAFMARKYWQELQFLLAKKPGSTLTIWNNEPVSKNLVTWIKKNTDSEKTFYDLVDEKNNSLKLI